MITKFFERKILYITYDARLLKDGKKGNKKIIQSCFATSLLVQVLLKFSNTVLLKKIYVT